MWVQSLSRDDPLEKEMATHSSIFAWRIPWTKEPGRLQSMGSQRVGHDWMTFTFTPTMVCCCCLVTKLCPTLCNPVDYGMVFPHSSVGKESACNAGDLGSIPGSGRSPGEGNGNPLQYSCLEKSMDRGAWQATVHGFAKSQTWLSMHACINDISFSLLTYFTLYDSL